MRRKIKIASSSCLVMWCVLNMVAVTSEAGRKETPEQVVIRLQSLGARAHSATEYIEGYKTFLDAPSRLCFEEYLEALAELYGMSLQEFYKQMDEFADVFGQSLGAWAFDLSQKYEGVFGDFRIDGTVWTSDGDTAVVSMSHAVDEQRFAKMILETFPFELDEDEKQAFIEDFKNSMVDSAGDLLAEWRDGRLITRVKLVNERDKWKIHLDECD